MIEERDVEKNVNEMRERGERDITKELNHRRKMNYRR